jgi:hypothetical protein
VQTSRSAVSGRRDQPGKPEGLHYIEPESR